MNDNETPIYKAFTTCRFPDFSRQDCLHLDLLALWPSMNGMAKTACMTCGGPGPMVEVPAFIEPLSTPSLADA